MLFELTEDPENESVRRYVGATKPDAERPKVI
jgi:hypothetical protein